MKEERASIPVLVEFAARPEGHRSLWLAAAAAALASVLRLGLRAGPGAAGS
jgi:hypothetical protein